MWPLGTRKRSVAQSGLSRHDAERAEFTAVYGDVLRTVLGNHSRASPLLPYSTLEPFARHCSSFFHHTFPPPLLSELNLILQQLSSRLLQHQSSSEILLYQQVEVLFEDYDYVYRRWRIRVLVAGQLFSLGHLPTKNVVTFDFAPVIANSLRVIFLRNTLFKTVPPHPDLLLLFRWTQTTALADQLLNYVRDHPPTTPPYLNPRLSAFDLQWDWLTQNNIVEQVTADKIKDLKVISVGFKVLKSDLKSSRFVWDGGDFDKLVKAMLLHSRQTTSTSTTATPSSPSSSPPLLPIMPPISIRNVARRVLSGWKRISTNDYKSFFFLIPIHPTLRNFMGMACRGNDGKTIRFFRMKVLPMGISFAPSTAQHVAEYTTQLLRKKHPLITFDIILWIDNVILLTNTIEDDSLLRRSYDEILAELGIVAKAWEVDTSLEALGLDIDLNQQIIRPSKKSLEKMNTALDNFVQTPSCRNFYKFHGSTMWISVTLLTFLSSSSPTSCLSLPDFNLLLTTVSYSLHYSLLLTHFILFFSEHSLESYSRHSQQLPYSAKMSLLYVAKPRFVVPPSQLLC